MTEELRVSGTRLQQRLAQLARFGALEDGGVCRLAFTEAEKAGQDYVEASMRRLGLRIAVDPIGNIIGIREGRRQGPLVVAGSHTDTVATGGRFDGSLGVMAALEVVETLNEAAVATEQPLAVISFANEEGARFMPDMMGSLVLSGKLSPEQARAARSADGTTAGDEMDRLGYAGTTLPEPLRIGCYVELHIEQGPILEQEGIRIGVVEAVQGIRWIRFRLQGAAAHAGATPISMRHDAAYVAGEAVRQARQLSLEIEGQRATVGSLSLAPNIVNVVAAEARFTADLRNPDRARLAEAQRRLLEHVRRTAAAEGVSVEHETCADVPPVAFDRQVVTTIETCARKLGYSTRRMTSGAGHDAQIMADICPAAMIFVPSRHGVSHNTEEYTSPGDCEAGANVLLQTILALSAAPGP